MNNAQIRNKIQSISSYAYSRAYVSIMGVYRNRLGIDEYTLKATMNPIMLLTTLFKLKENFESYLVGSTANHPAMSYTNVGQHVRNSMPTMAIGLQYVGDTPVNIPSVMNVLSEGVVFNTDTIGAGEYIKILNYKSKEKLEEDAARFENSEGFERAEKATEIMLTAAPYTTVRLYTAKNVDGGYSRALLVHGLTALTIQRIKALIFADQLTWLSSKADDATAMALLSIYTDNLEQLTNLSEQYPRIEIWDSLIDMFFKNEFENIAELLEKQRLEQIAAAVKNIPNAHITQMENTMSRARRDFDNAIDTLAEYERRYITACNNYERAKTEENTASKAIEMFFKAMGSNLCDVWISGDRLGVIANTRLMFFQADRLKPYKNNANSALCRAPKWVQQLVDEAFVTRTVTIHLTTGFYINITTGSLNRVNYGERANAVYNEEMRTGLPNPHHLHYNCFGDNTRTCASLVSQGKLDEALMTAYAATGGLNIGDTPVFNHFIEDLSSTSFANVPYIEKNGQRMTSKEYKELYEQEQKQKEQEATTDAQN